MQVWCRQLDHASYEEHGALVAQLQNSGNLQAAVQSLTVTVPVLPQCTEAPHAAAHTVTAARPSSHARHVLRLFQLVACTQQGKQALIQAGCCPHLMQLLSACMRCLYADKPDATAAAVKDIPSGGDSDNGSSSSSQDQDGRSSSASDSDSDSGSGHGGNVYISYDLGVCGIEKPDVLEEYSAQAWLTTPHSEASAEEPAAKRQKGLAPQQLAHNSQQGKLAVTMRQTRQLLLTGLQLLAELLCGAGTASPGIGQLCCTTAPPMQLCNAPALQKCSSEELCRQLMRQLQNHVMPWIWPSIQAHNTVPASVCSRTTSRPAQLSLALAEKVCAAAAMVVCRLSVELMMYDARYDTAGSTSGDAKDEAARCWEPSGSISLKQLLQPVALAEFLTEYWEQKPLHLTAGRTQAATVIDITSMRSKDANTHQQQQQQVQERQQQQQVLERQQQQVLERQQQQQVLERRQEAHGSMAYTAQQLDMTYAGGIQQPEAPHATGTTTHNNTVPLSAPDHIPAALPHGPSSHFFHKLLQATSDPMKLLLVNSCHLPQMAAHHSDALTVLQEWWTQQQLQPLHPVRLHQDLRLIRTRCHDPATSAEGSEGSVIDLWGEPNASVTPEECEKAVQEGYTLAVRAVGSRVAAVNELQAAISDALGVSPGANLYYTPPGAQGLAAHYDDHCVWVVQLQGCKQWLVKPPSGGADSLPMAYQQAVTTVPSLCRSYPAVQQYTLHPGDVLYLPRGWHHQADTQHPQAGFSLHLTLGAEVEPCLTWQAPLHAAVAEAAKHLLTHHQAAGAEGVTGGSTVGVTAAAGQVSAAVHVCTAQLLLHAALCRAASKIATLRRLCPLASQHQVANCLLQQFHKSPLLPESKHGIQDEHKDESGTRTTGQPASTAAACKALLHSAFSEVGLFKDDGDPALVQEVLMSLATDLKAALPPDKGDSGGEDAVPLVSNKMHTSAADDRCWLLAYWLDGVHLACQDINWPMAKDPSEVHGVYEGVDYDTDRTPPDMHLSTALMQVCNSVLHPGTLQAVQQLLSVLCSIDQASAPASCPDVFMHAGWEQAALHARRLLQARRAVNSAFCDLHFTAPPAHGWDQHKCLPDDETETVAEACSHVHVL